MVDNSTCPVDVIFILDESSSVKPDNFELSKSFLSQLVGSMDVDSGHTQVGLVIFADNVTDERAFNLNAYSTTASVQSAISSFIYGRGTTYTASALRYVREKMLTPAAGDRPDIPNVVFVMTDGESTVKANETKVCT